MPKKSNKRSKKGRTRKQKPIMMVGCSKKTKKSCKNKKVFSSNTRLRDNKGCPNCGPNCHCGPNCNCPHPCPGSCYLNRSLKGGSGCGSCGCPLSPMSWNQMNKFGGNMGSYPEVLNQPVMPDVKGGYQGILGIGQTGGTTCSACQSQAVQSGGNFYKPIGPMPGPIVGKAWGPDKLPGENGIGSGRNYLASYGGVISNDPQQQLSMNDAGYLNKNSMVGGYTYSPKKIKSSSSSASSKKKGGGLVPQDLVNLGRDFSFNFKSAYNALNGYKAPVDPSPYKDQLTGTMNNNRFYTT